MQQKSLTYYSLSVIPSRAFWPATNYVVNSQSSQGSLPSGTREKDMWKDLHLFLFKETGTRKKKIMRKGYLGRLEDGEELEITEQNTGDDCGAKASLHQESKRTSRRIRRPLER